MLMCVRVRGLGGIERGSEARLGTLPDLGCSSTFDQTRIFLSSFLFTLSASLFLPFTVLPSMGVFPVKMLQRLWWQQLPNPNLSLKYKVQQSGKESRQ